MPTYTEILNTQIDQDSPVTQPLLQALRDNPLASFEGDPLAPVNQWEWHPFNKVTVGDANDGRIWGFTANGAVASIITPDFQDGYDYKIIHQAIAQTSGASNIAHFLQLFFESLGNYDTTTRLKSATALMGAVGNLPWSYGAVVLINPRRLGRIIRSDSEESVIAAQNVNELNNGIYFSVNPDRVLRARIIPSNGGVITGNANSFFWLHRRRSIST